MAARTRLVLSLFAGAACLAACGTTVPLRSSYTAQSPGAGTGLGQSDPGSLPTTGPGSVPVQGGGSGGSSTGAAGAGGTTGGTSTSGGTVAPTVGTALPSGSLSGPAGSARGVTATTVKIGVYTLQGFNGFASSAGFKASTGDQVAEARQIIGYLNAHGGLAGRKIVPVFHDFNISAAASNPDTEYQAACAAWTQDDHVYAVVSPVGTLDDTLYQCLTKAGVPAFSSGESQDASFFQKFASTYYQPTDMNLRRVFTNQVDALVAARFFGAKPKVGVVYVGNTNETAAVNQGLKPALARHGLTLADSFAVSSGSGGATEYGSAVLRFKADGITHVLFSYLGSPLLFMNAAQNQGYHPKYGLSSRNSPASVLQLNAPPAQQSGAVGVGWQPENDVDNGHDPGVIGPRQKLCLNLLKQADQDTTNRATALIGLWFCDNFFFLQDSLRRAPSFSLAGLRAGAEAVGTYDAASTFRSSFGPGRLHDGAGAYRLFAFNDECACYRYTSPLRTAS